MKNRILLPLLALLCLLLPSCAGTDATEANLPTVRVSVEESSLVTVTNNGQDVPSGTDVTFTLSLADGYRADATDYDGEYELTQTDGEATLTLCGVRYPTEAALVVVPIGYEITYEPNGGDGEACTLYYDGTSHLRPNTDNGVNLFSRAGYTLIGWNTEPDGSGTAVGLGSRVTVGDEPLTLYAQWAKWSSEADFQYTLAADDTAIITGYTGNAETLVLPGTLGGHTVAKLAADAFAHCAAKTVVLTPTLVEVEADAFRDSELETLYLWDTIETISDASVSGCTNFTTLHINAAEPPYGFRYRRESVYADKLDLLILSQGQKKLICYSGCSAWYNLDTTLMCGAFQEYRVLDLALNGTVSSELQLQILAPYLEEGDVFFHTPEISSETQMMTQIDLTENDRKLWCGIEYNYDLLVPVDLKSISGVLDTFCYYLGLKTKESDYQDRFSDTLGRDYCGDNGEIPFERDETQETLYDTVSLDPAQLTEVGLARLSAWYERLQEMGVKVYISYACVNLDAVPEEERGNVTVVDLLYHRAFSEMPGVTVVSHLSDYLFTTSDFFDTNYHLLSMSAKRNTERWVRDLSAQMTTDGLLGGDGE